MPLNVPLPGSATEGLVKALDTGSNMFSRLMDPVIQRENQANQYKINQNDLAQRALEHKDNLAIQQMQQARLAQMLPYQLQELQDAHAKAQMETDPAKKNAYINAIMDNVYKMQNQATQAGTSLPQLMNQGQPQQQAQPMVPFSGMGMFNQGIMSGQQPQAQSQQQLQEMVQPPSQQTLQQGFGGLSPQQQLALSLAGIKVPAGVKNTGSAATNAFLTMNQKALQGIDTAVPVLDEILKDPDLPGIFTINPGKNAAFEAKTGGVIDTLVAAQNLPQVKESVDLVRQQVRRAKGETIAQYKKRIASLRDHLITRRNHILASVQQRSANPTEIPTSNEQLDNEQLTYDPESGEFS